MFHVVPILGQVCGSVMCSHPCMYPPRKNASFVPLGLHILLCGWIHFLSLTLAVWWRHPGDTPTSWYAVKEKNVCATVGSRSMVGILWVRNIWFIWRSWMIFVCAIIHRCRHVAARLDVFHLWAEVTDSFHGGTTHFRFFELLRKTRGCFCLCMQ